MDWIVWACISWYTGLAQSTGEGGLKAAFSRFGEVSRGATLVYARSYLYMPWNLIRLSIFTFVAVKLVLDKKTKQSLGYAYVWFVREEHARMATEEMNGQVNLVSLVSGSFHCQKLPCWIVCFHLLFSSLREDLYTWPLRSPVLAKLVQGLACSNSRARADSTSTEWGESNTMLCNYRNCHQLCRKCCRFWLLIVYRLLCI